MSIALLDNVKKVFGGGEPSAEERQRMVKEALLMTLARASSSDANIDPVEVSSVRELIRKATGDEVSEADVRVAARSEIFETTSLAHALGKLSHKLNAEDRALIAQSLAEVIKSDSRISHREVTFFDQVAHSLRISPSELVGLVPPSG